MRGRDQGVKASDICVGTEDLRLRALGFGIWGLALWVGVWDFRLSDLGEGGFMLDCGDYAGLGKIFVFDTEEGRLAGFQPAVQKKPADMKSQMLYRG